MNLTFLPERISSVILKLNLDKLYEIRLRKDYPIKILYENKKVYISKNGITLFESEGLICNEEDIEYIIGKVTEYSVYAFNDRIKDGYITTDFGIRIGLAGECVFSNGNIKTIKNISSLNIRIPHSILDCSKSLFKYIYKNGVINNSLIISPPFTGKTTLLKDLTIKLNDLTEKSILLIDERGEFSNIRGKNIDCISYSNKLYALTYGIRSLSPDVIITDELASREDWKCVENAINSGIKILASVHSDSIKNLKQKEYFDNLFDLYFVLEREKFGVINKIYDKSFNLI